MEKISIIVPCYNEEEALPLFYKEINKVRYNDLGSALEGLKRTFQEALAPAIEIVVNAISDLDSSPKPSNL